MTGSEQHGPTLSRRTRRAEVSGRRSTIAEVEATSIGSQELAAARFAVQVQLCLTEALADAHMTQRELARILGTTEGNVSQVLHGDGNHRVATIAKYLRAMGREPWIERIDVGETRRRMRAKRRGEDVPASQTREIRSADGTIWSVNAHMTRQTPNEFEAIFSGFKMADSRSITGSPLSAVNGVGVANR